MHYIRTLGDGLAAMWAVTLGFVLLAFVAHVAQCWMVKRTTKADRSHLQDERVLRPVEVAIEKNRDMLAERRAEKARAGGKADSREQPRWRSSRPRVLKLTAR